jgi:uncharacterized RDD family membrane protein YckC
MERTEHLKFCSICIHQKDGMRKGIICGLTDEIADFEGTCNTFTEDPEIIEQLKINEFENEVIDKMAGQGKRFLNYLLDYVFILVFICILCFILGIILAIVAPSVISDSGVGKTLIAYFITVIAIMIYYTVFETLIGRTIAKYITKTKVVTEIGEKPTFKMILIRSLCRFIPFEAFSFLLGVESGWHDTMSKTTVINI